MKTITDYRQAQQRTPGTTRIRRWTREEDLFLKSSSESMTMIECAQALNRSFSSVEEHIRYLRKKGAELAFIKRGENHHFCTHSSEDVELVRALVEEGLSVAEAARKLEVPYATAFSWVGFESRSHG